MKSQELEQLKKTYESMKISSIHLGQQIAFLQQEENGSALTFSEPQVDGATAEKLPSGVIRVNIPDLTPLHEPKKGDIAKEIRLYFSAMVANSLRNLNLEKQINKSVVLIVNYYPNYVVRDLDNHFLKPLIDGIRYSRVIADDNWRHLSYMVCGELDRERPRTELYLFDCETNLHLLVDWMRKIKKITIPMT